MAALYPKILFFIAGMTPTPEQLSEANDLGPGVMFRNATLVPPDGGIEEADGVAGVVPDNYAAALPNASDGAAVRRRMVKRDPNLAVMYGDQFKADEPPAETDAERQRRIDNALARGAKPASVHERNSEPSLPLARTMQSGHPRVTYPDSNDGWSSNPETLNDAAAEGRGVGATEGDSGRVAAAPVGPQGQGLAGAGHAPGAPTSGAGNPRAPVGDTEPADTLGGQGADNVGETTRPKSKGK